MAFGASRGRFSAAYVCCQSESTTKKIPQKARRDLWFLSGIGVGVYVNFSNDNGMNDDLTHTAPRRYYAP